MFSFKDIILTLKNNIITRRNKEYFKYIKRDIKLIYKLIVINILF